jgi:hypothetical protein
MLRREFLKFSGLAILVPSFAHQSSTHEIVSTNFYSPHSGQPEPSGKYISHECTYDCDEWEDVCGNAFTMFPIVCSIVIYYEHYTEEYQTFVRGAKPESRKLVKVINSMKPQNLFSHMQKDNLLLEQFRCFKLANLSRHDFRLSSIAYTQGQE